MALIDDLIAKFQEAQDRARVANETRYQQGLELFDRVIKQYETGGTFERATEAKIGRAGEKATASGMQALVSSGLAGTSIAAGLGKKFEEEVGQPARLEAQDIASQRTAQALEKKAGFIERREDIGPDFATIASLARTIGAEGVGDQSGTAGDVTGSSKVTGTATPVGDIGSTRVPSPQFSGLSFGSGGGGGRGGGLGDWILGQGKKMERDFKKRVSKPMPSAAGGSRGRMPIMAGQGPGTFILGPSKPKKTKTDLLKEGKGPIKSSGVPTARKLMQQADPFNISGRFF